MAGQKEVLDFSQVKDKGAFNPKHKVEGEYLGVITAHLATKSKSGNKMWVYTVTLKDDKRATYPVYCVLNPDNLWKLRDVMVAAGQKVAKKRISVDPTRIVGKEIGICLEDDEYEGKMKSVISAFFPASEFSGNDAPGGEDDEYEDSDLPEEDEEYEDDTVPTDEDEDDDDEDGDLEEDDAESDESDDAEESEDGEDAEEGDLEEEEDEEDEEPEPAPAPKVQAKRPAAKKAPARARKRPAPEADDEMDASDL